MSSNGRVICILYTSCATASCAGRRVRQVFSVTQQGLVVSISGTIGMHQFGGSSCVNLLPQYIMNGSMMCSLHEPCASMASCAGRRAVQVFPLSQEGLVVSISGATGLVEFCQDEPYLVENRDDKQRIPFQVSEVNSSCPLWLVSQQSCLLLQCNALRLNKMYAPVVYRMYRIVSTHARH